jgi:hypothetical protein
MNSKAAVAVLEIHALLIRDALVVLWARVLFSDCGETSDVIRPWTQSFVEQDKVAGTQTKVAGILEGGCPAHMLQRTALRAAWRLSSSIQ